MAASKKIEKYTDQMTFETFLENDLVSDAVIKNILVIGEAVKNIPNDFRELHPDIEWRKMAGMRDMMIHGYFAINYRIVWVVAKVKVPKLKQGISNILSN